MQVSIFIKLIMKEKDCVFCNIGSDKIILKNEKAYAIPDKYPHSKGHLLIIPFDHAEDFFELSKEDRDSIIGLLCEAKKFTDEKFKPAAYNVVINNGKSAGQVISHTHIHLIPRY